jgi:dual specificity tyrosine-phosphorylation-regulated kinase 2/3/4
MNPYNKLSVPSHLRNKTINALTSSSGKQISKITIESPAKTPRKSAKAIIKHQSQQFFSTGSKKFEFKEYSMNKLQFPILPKVLLHRFDAVLTKDEEEEVLEYDLVYYLRNNSFEIVEKFKIKPYDDKNGNYNASITDHIAFRYEILSLLGTGTFGQVFKCYDHKRKEQVALKIIKNKPSYRKQAILELKILQSLRKNDPQGVFNIVKIKNYFVFREHVCISTELLSLSLYDLLQQNNFDGFSITLIHRFAVQLLVCLQYLSKQKVIHCDLKPENILLKNTEKSLINVIDFGASCYEDSISNTYIQSRYYRAPEVILGLKYTNAIDVWSLGCILAELCTGYPLFPGESEHHQLICIMQVLGEPPKDFLSHATKRLNFFYEDFEPRLIPNKKGDIQTPGTLMIEKILSDGSEDFIDFVKKCLSWKPEDRLKPLEGLEHPWISKGLNKRPLSL